jgi:hypothetical protein
MVGPAAGQCPNVAATIPVTVKTASRIYGYGSGVYRQNGTDLNVISLFLELADTNSNTVAVSHRVPVSSFSPNNNGSAEGAVSGVLQQGNDPISVTTGGSTPFVARGSYTLKLLLTPASSPCPGQSFFNFINVSYVLLGTAP